MGNLTWLAPLIVGLLLSSCTKINPDVTKLADLSSFQDPVAPPPSTPPAGPVAPPTITCQAPTNLTLKSVGIDSTANLNVSSTGTGTSLSWKLNGADLPNITATQIADAAVLAVGAHVFEAKVTDSIGQVASCTFNVVRNAPPVLSSPSPSNTLSFVNYNSVLNYGIFASDPNGDALTYTWRLDTALSAMLNPAGLGIGSYTPMGVAQVGDHSISVEVSDGHESITYSWSVETNKYSDPCNQMKTAAVTNRTCVYVGRSSIGDGEDPTFDPSKFLVSPIAFVADSINGVFIADYYQGHIWYWNRSVSNLNRLGVDIPSGTMKVVAGAGGQITTATFSPSALRRSLRGIFGMAWDGSTLYVSETLANEVSQIDSAGVMTKILGGGASHTEGTQGNTHQCTTPRSLAYFGGLLYVTCSANHRVKALDLATGMVTKVAGNGGNTAPNDPTNSQPYLTTTFNTPAGLAVDNLGNIYIAESVGCRVRAWNRQGFAGVVGGQSISNDEVRTVWGSATSHTCGEVLGLALTARLPGPNSLFWDNGVLVVTTSGSFHAVYALNTNGFNVNLGSTNITSGFAIKLSGSSMNYAEGSPAVARFNTPSAFLPLPDISSFLIADTNNNRVRRLDSDFFASTIIGSGFRRGGSNAPLDTESPYGVNGAVRHLSFSKDRRELFFAESSPSGNIWMVDSHGQLKRVIGGGASIADDISPETVGLNTPNGVLIMMDSPADPGVLIYSETSTRHWVRAWNRGTASRSVFGQNIGPNQVRTIAGATTSGNLTSGLAVGSSLNNPVGLATDGTNLFIADKSNHCVKKVDALGMISAVAGTCGTAANAEGPVGVGRMNQPDGLSFYNDGTAQGLLIADAGNSRIRFHNLSGATVTIGTIPVLNDNTKLIAGGGTLYDEGLSGLSANLGSIMAVTQRQNDICWTGYQLGHVRCLSTVTGIVRTVHGAVPGVGSTSHIALGGSVGDNDQNNVVAAPGLIDPALGLSSNHGRLSFPYGLTVDHHDHLLIGEFSTGLIRLTIPSP